MGINATKFVNRLRTILKDGGNMFQEGDVVQIRHHTEDERANYKYYWNPHMTTMEGNIYIIYNVLRDDYEIADKYGTWVFAADSIIPYSRYEQF